MATLARRFFWQNVAWLSVACALVGYVGPGRAATSVTRIEAYDYDATTGLVTKHIVEPTNSDLCSSTTFSYDLNLGLLQSTASANCNGVASTYPGSSSATNTEAAAPGASSSAPFTSRTNSSVVTYNTDGTFKVVSTNAESEGDTKIYGNAYGELKSDTDANQLLTSWQYDALGRRTLETRPDGTSTKWTYEYCSGVNGGSASCPTTLNTGSTYSVTAYPYYVVTEQPQGTDSKANGAYTKRYYDTYDRVIRVETQGFDADTGGSLLATIKLIYQDTTYNSQGLVATKSRPYYSSDTPVVDQYKYDYWGRVLKVTAADASTTGYNYNGLVRTITNTDGKTTIETQDESGQVVKITDAYSKDLKKSYDPFGNLTQTVDSAGNTVAMQYDARGRKYAMQDPDLGSWTYGYDALGNLVTQTDAKSQTTTFTYDLVQRLTAKAEPTLNTNWYYTKSAGGFSCGLGIGKLCEAKASNGYDRYHDYDSYGRLDAIMTRVSSTDTKWSLLGYSYDANGRLLEVDYPSGFSVQYAYTPLGFLWKMEDSVAAPTSVYWRAQAMDAEMHLTQHIYGNNVSTTNAYFANSGRLKSTVATGNVQNIAYDYWPLGNLKTRNDGITGVNASYTYDDISRLKTETLAGGALSASQVITWDYDDIGNPQDRADGSNYTNYGYTGTRPHAITIAAGNINGAAVVYYYYDANGNLNRTSGSGRSSTVAWTSFNMVDTITKTVGGTPSVLNFKYSPEHDRVQEIYTLNGVLQRTTTYLSPNAANGVILYEEERNELTKVTKKKSYLSVGDNTIGVVTYTTGSTTPTQQYWHKDNLGSVMVISDANGNAIERLAYEPFGKRRQSTGGTDTNGTLVATNTERGFTEHEMLDEVGLVNMNGRVYDPSVGRFLSADPSVPHPGDMQSYDRYSYARNNPTNEIDLTGFFDDCSNVLCGISGGVPTIPGLNGGNGTVNNGLCYGQTIQFCLSLSGNNNGLTGGVTVGGGGGGSAPPPAINFNNVQGTGSTSAQTFNQGQYADSLGLNNNLGKSYSIWDSVTSFGYGLYVGTGNYPSLVHDYDPADLDPRAFSLAYGIGNAGRIPGQVINAGVWLLSGGAEYKAAKETTTLFRAVGPEEFLSVMNSKKFSFAPNGTTMKQFGFSADEVMKFANFAPDYAAILRVEVPTSALKVFNVSKGQIDPFIFKSGVLTLEGAGDLKSFNSVIKSVGHEF